MAWITPVTDRTTGARCTITDMNRIAGNLDWLTMELTAHQLYSGATISKTTYIANDYGSISDWENILEVLNDLSEAVAIETGNADNSTTYDNFNAVESITLEIYNRYELISSQSNNNHYPGDGYYTQGIESIYSGGFAA